jgi:segregation and condensation protein A
MASPAQRAIAILIEMAEQGEIDPWDVKVIDVIDRFLVELKLDDLSATTPLAQRHPSIANYEANLSESGQAFLYASMLVLLKADTLVRLETEIAEENEPELALEEIPDNVIPLPVNLERKIQRRAVARPPQQRRVTLAELIEQLKVMAETMENPPLRPKARQPRPQSAKQAVRAIRQLSQQENPAEIAEAVGQFVETNWRQLTQGQEWLDFETLLTAWSDHKQQQEKPDRVGVFWSLLLLTAQSKVEVHQTELYGSIQIRLMTPEVIELQPAQQVAVAGQ